MSHNNLTGIEEDALGRLEILTILKLDNNRLTHIPPSLPDGLMKLYMHNNQITDVTSDDFSNLINLQVLDVSGNRIIYMPQLLLPSLITLSARQCGLENIHVGLAKTCPSLRHLLIDGNLITCAQLMEIEQCHENSVALTNEYISASDDDIDYNHGDVERKERHLNSISYFPSAAGKCHKGPPTNEGAMQQPTTETVPNCWNEKLITSFILTNESTTTTAASNDNKLQLHDAGATTKAARRQSKGNPSSGEDSKSLVVADQRNKGSMKQHETMNGKLALPVSVVKMEIKEATTGSNSSGGGSTQKGLMLMKTKQIKASSESKSAHDKLNQQTAAVAASNAANAANGTTINRNLIDNSDYGKANKFTISTTAAAMKAINDNEAAATTNNNNNNNNSKSIEGEQQHERFTNDNKSRSAHNGSVNGPSLAVAAVTALGNGNAAAAATDQQQQHQHHEAVINHTVNGVERQHSERWNDVREVAKGSIDSGSHPGLLIVIGVSIVGVLFTFIVAYMYRCNFINSARRRPARGGSGSCETINEGRDVLNDNFNEEIHSFTIETHNHCGGCAHQPLTATSSAVNQSDLLPMDVLNCSTLGPSIDRPHISMHLW